LDERPGQGDALLLTARELVGRRSANSASWTTSSISSARAGLAGGTFFGRRPKRRCRARHVREQGVLLEDGVDVALVRRDVDTSTPSSRPARGRQLEAGDHLEQGRLAAAGRAEHGEELAAAIAKSASLDGDERPNSLRTASRTMTSSVAGRPSARDRRRAWSRLVSVPVIRRIVDRHDRAFSRIRDRLGRECRASSVASPRNE
jgi:hypothetical protein